MLSKEKLESLKIQMEAIGQSHDFWINQISPLADRLEKLCNKNFNTPEEEQEIEKLSREVGMLQRKGEINDKILKDFSKTTNELLVNNLVSGIHTLRLDY